MLRVDRGLPVAIRPRAVKGDTNLTASDVIIVCGRETDRSHHWLGVGATRQHHRPSVSRRYDITASSRLSAKAADRQDGAVQTVFT
jgi:hypothetical protein